MNQNQGERGRTRGGRRGWSAPRGTGRFTRSHSHVQKLSQEKVGYERRQKKKQESLGEEGSGGGAKDWVFLKKLAVGRDYSIDNGLKSHQKKKKGTNRKEREGDKNRTHRIKAKRLYESNTNRQQYSKQFQETKDGNGKSGKSPQKRQDSARKKRVKNFLRVFADDGKKKEGVKKK